MCKKMAFSYTFSHILPRSVASLPRFGTPLTNPGCTTVTAIAKGTRVHAPPPAPLIGVLKNTRRGSRGLVLCHFTNNGFQCARNVVFIHEFSKNLPTVGGGKKTPTPSPRSVASLPRFGPR